MLLLQHCALRSAPQEAKLKPKQKLGRQRPRRPWFLQNHMGRRQSRAQAVPLPHLPLPTHLQVQIEARQLVQSVRQTMMAAAKCNFLLFGVRFVSGVLPCQDSCRYLIGTLLHLNSRRCGKRELGSLSFFNSAEAIRCNSRLSFHVFAVHLLSSDRK